MSRVRGWLFEGVSYVRASLPGRRPEVRFVLVAYGRTGSHLLVDLLNAHPAIEARTERGTLHGRRGVRRPALLLEGLSRAGGRSVFGCKVSPRHLQRQHPPPEDVMRALHERGWRFVALTRRNVFRAAISSQLALQQHRYHDRREMQAHPPDAVLAVPRLVTQMEKNLATNELVASLLAPYPHLALVYEDDLLDRAHHQRTADRVFDFLEVPRVRVETTLVRTGRRDLSYIANLPAVVAALRGTRFAPFLDQP